METLTAWIIDRLGVWYSPEQLMVALVGAASFCVVLAGWMLVNVFTDPVRSRLSASANPLGSNSGTRDNIDNSYEKYRSLLLPSNANLLSRTTQRLNHAGFHFRRHLFQYYALRMLLIVGLPVALLVIVMMIPGRTLNSLLQVAVLAAVIGYIAPSFVLDRLIKRRQRTINRAMPDALDLLVVCSEAGLSFDAALQKVAAEISFSQPVLAEELGVVIAEVRAGVDRRQAYTNLINRTGVDEIRGLMSIINQSMRFGVSIAETLRIYSEEFRDRRLQAAEATAAKIGAKLIFPLAMCLLPCFMLIVFVPFALNIMKAFQFLG
ncbi:MAG: type II secretion system F family protein [Methylococcaceae bacterium]|nr:type II secretion system F family protein [Methylococcaceae bacterium]